MTAVAGAGEVAELYDWLSRYVQVANRLAYGDRFADFTMHKPLAAEGSGGALAGMHTVHDRLLAVAGLPREPRVLDAGCGFGGTVFRWCGRIGGHYDGLTLSRVQLKVARREARRRGWEARCRFHLQSFDQPLPGTYDGIVAIETLVHAADFPATLARLAAALRPGGRLLVVEDVAAAPLGEAAAHDLALLREHWGCPRLPAADDYRQGFAAGGLALLREDDLTPHVRFRAPELLDRLERRYTRLRAALPWKPARAVLAAYLGGLAVERLYAAGRLGYRLFVAGRPLQAGAEAEAAP